MVDFVDRLNSLLFINIIKYTIEVIVYLLVYLLTFL